MSNGRDPRVSDVLLVSDVRLYRDGLASMLAADGRVAVVGTVTTDDDLSATAGRANVVVVAPSSTDEAAVARRVAASARRPLVVVAVPDSDDAVVGYAEAGVLGFLDQDSDLDELVACVDAAARGEAFCPPRITSALLHRVALLSANRATAPDSTTLTLRERQIAALIDKGLSNKEIAQRLYIEVATVKNHVHNILEKLQVSSRGEAAAVLRLDPRPSGAAANPAVPDRAHYQTG